MKKIISALLSFICIVAHAEIQVQVVPSQVTAGEPFQLNLTQENSQNSGVPDLTVLQHDFAILGTERNINYSIINGHSQSVSQWTIALKALKSGIVTIPAIKVGAELSSPITINVQPGSKAIEEKLPANQQDVFLMASTNETKPYVNQQIMYTVKVFNSKRLLDAEYQGPQVEDALLIPLGDTKRYQTQQNDINYIVEEQNYAIFPQKSGTLKITSPVFSALIYDMNPQQIKVQDEAIELAIQPVPKKFKGKEWIPAKEVKLTEHYENSVQTIDEGSTLTRTIILEGVGLPAQLLPKMNFTDTDSFKVYPEKAKEENKVVQGELVGKTEIKVTYLFNKSGKVAIPELKLAWFNTQTGQAEEAVLPPRSIKITPASTSNSANSAKQNLQKETNLPVTDDARSEERRADNTWAWLVAIGFALAWVVTLLLWSRQKQSRTLGGSQYKTALTNLNKACSECNPAQARDALLKWATLHWPDAPLLNLTDLTQLVRDVHLKKQLNLLSQVLYRSEEKTLWRGDELLRCVMALSKTKPGKNKKVNTLPPINPF